MDGDGCIHGPRYSGSARQAALRLSRGGSHAEEELLKNIIIAGPPRAGKSTLARRLNQELNYFVISADKLVAAFGEAYPQLDIRLAWDREKTTDNIAPFLGHFLGLFSSADGRGLLSYSYGAVRGNRFVMEGVYFNFEKILPILAMYGIAALEDEFTLIGLVQNQRTVDQFVRDCKIHDTKDDWTYGFGEDELRDVAGDALSSGLAMADHLTKYGFSMYDTSVERERVFDQIIEGIGSAQCARNKGGRTCS